jgi:hypothetical protein
MASANNTTSVMLTSCEIVESLIEASTGSAQLSGVAGNFWRMFSLK